MIQKIKKIFSTTIYNEATPTSCTVYMTDRCNFKCKGCYRSKIGSNLSKEMTLETIKSLLKSYSSLNSFMIVGLGEPTLADNFTEIVEYLIENNKRVNITTNGFNSTKIMKLKSTPNYVNISLNGFDDNSYKEYTGISCFNEVIESYKNISSLPINVGFSYILTNFNYLSLKKVLEICDDLKPNFLNLFNYIAYDIKNKTDRDKTISVHDKKTIKYIDEFCSNKKYLITKPKYVDYNNHVFNCKSYSNIINVDGEGNIGGCQRQIPPNQIYGNILETIDPYNSKKMKDCRIKQRKVGIVHEECEFCFGNW
jgi:MoaA/NifB/PqqE/SkfB family radical SAM enzyme